MKPPILLLACLAFPLSLFADGGLPDQPYIYVEGKAEIERMADMVTLKFYLVTRNVDQAKANQEVQSKAGRILALLNDRKIAHGDVIAEDLKSEPEYENEEESITKRGKVIGFTVSREFEVKVRDVTAFPKLVDDLFGVGQVQFTAVDGGLAKEKETRDEAWDNALADARRRAEKTAKSAGMKIESVFAISPVAFPEVRQKMLGGSRDYATAESHRSEPDPLAYRLAAISVTQSVHMIYLISPAK